jgi:hypothetical protein
VSAVDADLLIYDQVTHQVHHLNTTAASVWRACDGQRTVADLAVATGVSLDLVGQAVTTLDRAGLLASPLPATLRATRQSRRAFVKAGAAAGVAVPVVISMTAPIAAGVPSGQCWNLNCQIAIPQCIWVPASLPYATCLSSDQCATGGPCFQWAVNQPPPIE